MSKPDRRSVADGIGKIAYCEMPATPEPPCPDCGKPICGPPLLGAPASSVCRCRQDALERRIHLGLERKFAGRVADASMIEEMKQYLVAEWDVILSEEFHRCIVVIGDPTDPDAVIVRERREDEEAPDAESK